MNQPDVGYSAVYSRTEPCPSCGMPTQQPVAQSTTQTINTQSQIAAQIPPQPVPPMTPTIPPTPYRRVSFQRSTGASPSTALIQVPPVSGSAGFMPNMPPETFSGAITDLNQPMLMTVEGLQYLNGFLRTQVERHVRVGFLLGTDTMIDRSDTLLGVGADYILVNESDSGDLLACDFYNVKPIRFYY